MYEASKEVVFRAGHGLALGAGERERVHRHNWRVRATVRREELNGEGLVLDFQELERALRGAVEPLSQAARLEDLEEFRGMNPSTERVARTIYERLRERLPAGVELAEVAVWETGSCRAAYRP